MQNAADHPSAIGGRPSRGAEYMARKATSEFRVNGRLVLNLWKIYRKEVSFLMYYSAVNQARRWVFL